MTIEETFNLFKTYFQTELSCQEALSKLKPGVEIGVTIGDKINVALGYNENSVLVESRVAKNPDVIFNCKPESIYLLTESKGISVSNLGILISKEILAGNISVKVPGSLWGLATNGYLEMVKLGGAEFLSYLAQHGFSTYAQVMTLINKFKNK